MCNMDYVHNRSVGVFHLLTILCFVVGIGDALHGCYHGQFSYGTNAVCSDENCAGSCIDDYICCVDECFNLRNLAAQKTCKLGAVNESETAETNCRNTLQEIDCVANLSDSTFAICLHQVSELVSRGTATIGTVDPVNCPCSNGYTKLVGACAIDCGPDSSRCQNITDVWTGTPSCCIHNGILPSDADCQATEVSIQSVISMTMDACDVQCKDTCRQTGSDGHLPVCCKTILIPEAPKDDSDGIKGGTIALIVTLVILILVILAAITIWYLRKRSTIV